MNSEASDVAKKKRFMVSIYEIRQEIVFAEDFSDRYVKTVTLSDGTTRTIELTPTTRGGQVGMQFNDTGYLTFMRMLPVRNAGHTNGQLMVRVFDCDDATLSRVIPPGTSLTTIPEFVPPGFIQGLEILNDDSTPMEFVVGVLSSHLGLSREDSVATMLAIHERGGALIATQSPGEAQKIAETVTVQAGLSGYPLICRAVTLE